MSRDKGDCAGRSRVCWPPPNGTIRRQLRALTSLLVPKNVPSAGLRVAGFLGFLSGGNSMGSKGIALVAL